ncbi:MAG: energy transducer TonB [Bacteroidales bacterium]|nr:energy transducer TonB [Bacteroidales bacterium]
MRNKGITMKNLIQLIIFFLISCPCLLSGQELIRDEYYDINWNKISMEKAYYTRNIYKQNDTAYYIEDFIKNKRLDMTGYASSIDPIVEHGVFTFYKKGIKTFEYYYKNGDLKQSVRYGKDNVTKTDYNFNVVYVTATNNNLKDDSIPANPYEGQYTHPTFQGGGITDKFRLYIAMNLLYPSLAVKYRKTGKVHISFTVNEKGEVTEINITESIYKDLDKEAYRVILNSPKWEPGQKDGKPFPVRYNFPVSFILAKK